MMSDELLRCRSCRGRTSLTAGTIFEGTRKPLRTWFMAMWFVTSQKNGVSALGLQRVLGLGSYETAWTWLHKLRRAMVRPGRDRLNGIVEVDETYVGRAEKGKWGREIESKAIVALAVEEDGKGVGRIRLRRVKDVSADSLLPFVQGAVVTGATIHTDGWSGYAGLKAAGYKHRTQFIHLGWQWRNNRKAHGQGISLRYREILRFLFNVGASTAISSRRWRRSRRRAAAA
jgi:hypothetical protein